MQYFCVNRIGKSYRCLFIRVCFYSSAPPKAMLKRLRNVNLIGMNGCEEVIQALRENWRLRFLGFDNCTNLDYNQLQDAYNCNKWVTSISFQWRDNSDPEAFYRHATKCLLRNKIAHKQTQEAIRCLIAIRKYRKSCWSRVPKELIRLIGEWVWETRGD